MGVPVFDADSRAKSLMNTNEALKADIASLLGEGAYSKGEINRSWVAKKVFADPSLLSSLNGLVHPAVGKDYDRWVGIHSHHPILLKEAALLFETGLAQKLHQVVVVVAPLEMRILRVLNRDKHRSRSDIEAIIANQSPDAEKIKFAHFVIHNDEKHGVIPQVLNLHQQLLSKLQ